jgi:hypothetical protein
LPYSAAGCSPYSEYGARVAKYGARVAVPLTWMYCFDVILSLGADVPSLCADVLSPVRAPSPCVDVLPPVPVRAPSPCVDVLLPVPVRAPSPCVDVLLPVRTYRHLDVDVLFQRDCVLVWTRFAHRAVPWGGRRIVP